MDNITYKIKLSTGIPQIPKYKNVRTKHWEVVKPSYVSTSVGETKGKPVVRLTDLIIGETQNKQKLWQANLRQQLKLGRHLHNKYTRDKKH